ncbi:galactose oxidase [Paenibacillus sp. D9]|nr:galactose oxidase [Paenibacillus sp. D9]
MVNGLEKEYDLTVQEVSAFIAWFDTKDAGTGPAKYAFNKTWNKGPFSERTEYVIFEKILTFNVDEYSTKE